MILGENVDDGRLDLGQSGLNQSNLLRGKCIISTHLRSARCTLLNAHEGKVHIVHTDSAHSVQRECEQRGV